MIQILTLLFPKELSCLCLCLCPAHSLTHYRLLLADESLYSSPILSSPLSESGREPLCLVITFPFPSPSPSPALLPAQPFVKNKYTAKPNQTKPSQSQSKIQTFQFCGMLYACMLACLMLPRLRPRPRPRRRWEMGDGRCKIYMA